MKRYIDILKCAAVTAVAATMASCNFLDIDNPSYATDALYDTHDGQQKLITDIYSKFRNVYNTGELQYYGTDMYMAVTESPDEKMFNGYDKTFNSTAGVITPYWQNLYKIVQECNTLIARCTPEETKDDYEPFVANGKFFRALAYYYLVETFGAVPFYTQENDGLITSATRDSEEKIYGALIADMEAIKGILPAKSAKKGDINNGAVLQLLGKLYLTRAYRTYARPGDFADAAGCFEAIIDDPASYRLLGKFSDVFDPDRQNNAEVIWSIQYGDDKMYSGGGNPQQALFGFNITALRPQWYEKVQNDYSAMQRGYWLNPQVHEWFADPSIDSRYDATFVREFYVNNSKSDDLGKLGLYFPRWNDAADDDKGALEYIPFKKDGNYFWYPQSTALQVLEGGSDFLPMIRKFKDTKMTWGGAGTREDVVMRVADTYLLCAEAWLGAGESGIALGYLNEVRKRAAVDEAAKTAMTLSVIDLDVVLDERGRELLGEHDRWFDLKRTGKLIERARKYNIFVVKYDNINENHLLRPIPSDETNKVEGLTQNEGYN